MTEGYQECIFLYILEYSSRPRMAKTKCVKGKEEQGEGVIPCQLIQNFSKMKPYLVNFFLIWGGGGTLSIMRHVKIQNFSLIPLIAYDLWDFTFS